jgi:hypothetical protein
MPITISTPPPRTTRRMAAELAPHPPPPRRANQARDSTRCVVIWGVNRLFDENGSLTGVVIVE